MIAGFFRFLGWLILWLIALICSAWAFGAVWYDSPWPALRMPLAAGLGLLVLLIIVFLPRRWRKVLAVFAVFGLVLTWWLTLQPQQDRPWQADVARVAWAEIKGDEITLHEVRNCEYRTELDYTPRWETRTVRLSQLTGMDLAITYWGSPYIAHPIVSYRFADAPPICFSIETRKEVGENYSSIGGFFRQYELVYIVADERDVLRLRTNFRQGEDMYLYHSLASPERARARFLEYVATLNSLRDQPRWYNAATTNCTTAIRAQRPPEVRTPWDWRILINGKGDEMLYEHGAIATGGLPFPQLKEASHINARARAANDAPDFSAKIREGVPGFSAK